MNFIRIYLLSCLIFLLSVNLYSLNEGISDANTRKSADSGSRDLILDQEKTNLLSIQDKIILTEEVIANIQQLRQTNELLEQLIGVVQWYADSALTEGLMEYIPGNTESDYRREIMFNVFNLALTYRLTGDTVYAAKVKEHLINVAGFPDWGSHHFLNVGEITTFMGLGYNWIYEYLTEEERETIRAGIIHNGLREGIKAYNGNNQIGWWVNRDNNWNQVCNAGLTIGALAVAEHWPDSSAFIIENAVESLELPMEVYSPDGAWYEGPTYWAYGTTYNALMLDALKTATGSFHNLDNLDSFEDLGKSGLFHIQTAGPTGLYFNYADAKKNLYFSPVLFWMANEYDKPVYAWFERLLCQKDYPRMLKGDLMKDDTLDRFLALLVIWFNDQGENFTYDDLPFDTKFQGEGVDLFAMRSSWSDNATYLAGKAGSNQVSHAHLDAGTFVLDAKGERWAFDLGGENYDLPGYWDFDGGRWQYYRTGNKSHNTLVINEQLHNIYAVTEITQFFTQENHASTFMNLTDAYIDESYATNRKFDFPDRDKIFITDEIIPKTNNSLIRWGMITYADIELQANQAILTQNNKQIRLQINHPEGIVFDTISTYPGNNYEYPNTGTRMLAFYKMGDAGELINLEVEFNFADTLFTGQTHLENLTTSPDHIQLRSYPNPSKKDVNIHLHLKKESEIKMEIFNVMGERVEVIANKHLSPGDHHFRWGRSSDSFVKPGVYLLVCKTQNNTSTSKIMITD